MGQTKYHRAKTNCIMKGFIALLMKATNIEVSYEKFKGHDRDISGIWERRLLQAQMAFLKADDELEHAWRKLFPGEVDKMSRDSVGLGHAAFADQVYGFLTDKYPWMYWGVLIYDPVAGWDNHAVHGKSGYTHHQFRHHGRNFHISCTHPYWRFDRNAAFAGVVQCLVGCENTALEILDRLPPMIGVSEAVLRFNVNYAWRAESGREVRKEVTLRYLDLGLAFLALFGDGSAYGTVSLPVFYFG